MKKLFNTRKFKYGSLSIIFAVVFIAIVIVLNLVVESITERFSLTQDITTDGIYTISDTTKDMLNNLSENVSVYIMMTQEQAEANSGFKEANEVLKRMVSQSGSMMSIEYVDLTTNPSFRNNFSSPDSVVPGSIIMKSSKRDIVIDVNDLYSSSYDFQTGESYTSGYQADQKFASSLHYVTTEDIPNVAFITGHGETLTNEPFNDIFSNNSYAISEIELLSEDIPEDIDMLVIYAPTSDFSEGEIEKLNEYLTRPVNNNLIMINSPEMSSLERLNRYMSEWGVSAGSNLVVDPERAYGADPTSIISEMVSHEITDDIINSGVANVVVPLATDIEVVYEQDNYRSTAVLMQSSDTSYGKDFSSETAIEDLTQASGDAQGPFPLMVLSTDYQYIKNESTTHNVLFVASAYMVASSLLEDPSFQNANIITSSLDFMNPSVDAVIVEPVEFSSPVLNLVGNQAITILIIFAVILPLCFIGLGIFVFIRRKNK